MHNVRSMHFVTYVPCTLSRMFRALCNAGVAAIEEAAAAPSPPKPSLVSMLLKSGIAELDQSPQKRPRKQPRPAVLTDYTSCSNELRTKSDCGCEQHCWQRIFAAPFNGARVMGDMRRTYKCVTRNRQSAALFKMMLPYRRINSSGSKPYYLEFNIRGLVVCGHVWCEFVGVSYQDSRMKKLCASLRKGDNSWVPHTPKEGNHVQSKGIWATSFIRRFIIDNCDWHPENSKVLLDPNPLLVYYMLYVDKWINRHVCADQAAQGPLRFTHFCRLWNEFKSKPLTHNGSTYKIVVRPPRYLSIYECVTCTCQ